MKVKLPIPKRLCRRCVYNDYRKVGVDYCVRAGCVYKIKEEEKESTEENAESM